MITQVMYTLRALGIFDISLALVNNWYIHILNRVKPIFIHVSSCFHVCFMFFFNNMYFFSYCISIIIYFLWGLPPLYSPHGTQATTSFAASPSSEAWPRLRIFISCTLAEPQKKRSCDTPVGYFGMMFHDMTMMYDCVTVWCICFGSSHFEKRDTC